MADVHDKRTRSRNMSAISSKNTRPELTIRKILHSSGYRYRINVKSLRGNPDICLPAHNALIFVHGCFWHHHDCHLFAWPKTRKVFWETKIYGNVNRDHETITHLLKEWRVAIVWECSMKGKTRIDSNELYLRLHKWIESREPYHEIQGTNTGAK